MRERETERPSNSRERGRRPAQKPVPAQSHSSGRAEIPHGSEGIEAVGHREYVGGLWDSIGKLQFDFLVDNGLRPHHYLLDVACGSLRGGVHFIPYLDPGHYLGLDKEPELIAAGVEQELGVRLFASKAPQLVVSKTFEFERFSARPDYALAQSLFTHLPPPVISECLTKLRLVIHPEGVFFATFFETSSPRSNPETPHDSRYFAYTRQEMENFGSGNGWAPCYLGDWNHPRNQVIVQYRPA